MTSIIVDYNYQNTLRHGKCIQYFFFCEELLVCDTNLHYKDCRELNVFW